jgi:hypothetical protein
MRLGNSPVATARIRVPATYQLNAFGGGGESMLGTILAVLGYTILGAAVLIGGIFGFAWYLAREINAGHEPACTCPTCQGQRLRRWQRDKQRQGPAVNRPDGAGRDRWGKDHKPLPTRSEWISTLELRAGMKVLGKETGTVYRVTGVHEARFGYMVALVNSLTGRESNIPVQRDKAQQRIWLVRRPGGGK